MEEKVMLRKAIVVLFAVAMVGLVSPEVAAARGFGGGHGGFGGFRGGGFGPGFGFGALGAGLGYGLYGPYGYYGGYYGYPAYAYDDYYDGGGCYLVRRRVLTRYGWRIRPVQVCG
jgi:hypothetical protein